MRKYIYEPYSSQAVVNSTNERDEGSRSLASFGAKRYEISERSSDMPGELQRLDTWTEAPVTDEQKQYLESEAVYRDFVYVNYLTADPQLSGLIKELFHKEEEEASLSVYAAVQQIRTVLEENTYYNKYLSEADTAGGDLLNFCCRTCTEKFSHSGQICRRISSYQQTGGKFSRRLDRPFFF